VVGSALVLPVLLVVAHEIPTPVMMLPSTPAHSARVGSRRDERLRSEYRLR